MKELDRWTTASSNCLGYAPDDGELVKFEDAMEIITPLREALQQIMGLDEVSGYSDTYRIAADALELVPPPTPPPCCETGTMIRQNLPRTHVVIGTYVDHTLPPGTLEVWQDGKRLGRIENIGSK